MTDKQDPIAHAARLLREAAEELRQAHAYSNSEGWENETDAKAAYDDHLAAAQALEDWEQAVGAGGVQALSAAPAGFVPVAAFDSLHTESVPAIQGEMNVQLGCGAEPPGIQALMCVISSLRDIAHFSDEEGGELMSALCALRDWAHAQTVAAPQPAPHLPERDASLPAERQGLFRKFVVGRVDGSDKPGGKHHGCTYFVLDVDHDPCARPALAAYAAACESTHPTLAADLRTKWGVVPAPQQEAQEPATVPYQKLTHEIDQILSDPDTELSIGAKRALLWVRTWVSVPLWTTPQPAPDCHHRPPCNECAALAAQGGKA